MANSFFLFVIFYFGVVFVAILGLFWNDMRFFGLAIINFFALCAFLLTSAISKKKEAQKNGASHEKQEKEEEKKEEKEEKEKPVNQAASHHSQFVKYPYMKTSKKGSKGLRSFLTKYRVIIRTLIGILIVWEGISLSSNYDLYGKIGSALSSRFSSLFEKENQDPYLYTGAGSVLGTGTLTGNTGDMVFEESGVVLNTQVNDVFLGNNSSGTTEELSGTSAPTPEPIVDTNSSLKEKLGITNTSSVSIMNALVYLMDTNKISLSSKTNVGFKYVTSKNTYYPYFVTAYQKQIVGASTNPSTKITCDTYQVFKGMIQGWDLKYTAATVKSVFWAEAQKKGVLNGCVQGKLLKGENL